MNYTTISSKDNTMLKKAKALLTKKGRKEQNKMLVEGKKTVADLLKFNIKMQTILFSEQTKDFVLSLQPPPDIELVMLEKNLIGEITHQTTSQEVVAVVDMPKVISQQPNTNFLVLDGLQDAGNVGTILRTALATGFNTIYLLDCVDVFSPKVVDSSMTAVFHLNLIKMAKREFITFANKQNLKILSADFGGQNALNYKAPSEIIGLVIGNEGNGVSEEINNICIDKLTLPMSNKIESLNASVSAGILMYLINASKMK